MRWSLYLNIFECMGVYIFTNKNIVIVTYSKKSMDHKKQPIFFILNVAK